MAAFPFGTGRPAAKYVPEKQTAWCHGTTPFVRFE
jgi:hypothetical protein